MTLPGKSPEAHETLSAFTSATLCRAHAGAYPHRDPSAQVLAFAILIGGIALPGAFLAKASGGDRRRRALGFRRT